MNGNQSSKGMTYDYDSFHKILEGLAVFLFPLTTVGLLYFTLINLEAGPIAYGLLVGTALLGYLAADLISGMVHWLADNYGSEETPLLGENFIKAFRWHHVEPRAMCEFSFVATIGNSCMLAIPIQSALMALLFYGYNNIWWVAFALLFNAAAVGTVFANQFHKWAHFPEDERPAFIVWLQNKKLILEPEHHSIHHEAPYDTYYCVTNGWLNWILDKTGFWKKMEWFLGLFGLHPDPSAGRLPLDYPSETVSGE